MSICVKNYDIAYGKLPVDTGHKLNVHKTFRRRPGRLLNVLCPFNLRPVSTGLLGIKTDHRLNFNTHIGEITKKNRQKLNVLSRLTPYMDLSE